MLSIQSCLTYRHNDVMMTVCLRPGQRNCPSTLSSKMVSAVGISHCALTVRMQARSGQELTNHQCGVALGASLRWNT
jgi:hypothetical protein